MAVLFLGNIGSPIIEILKSHGSDVVVTSQILELKFINELNPEFVVSYGFPHIVAPEVIDHVKGNIINLHISYLPWNRGADPDFWSLVDDTPKGVTIHYMAAALDAGDIIAQKEVVLDDNDTLATYYKKLHVSILGLFRENWASIRNGTCLRIPQGGGGSYHRSVDKNSYIHLLGDGPDTPARKILNAKR
jgi:methionyl-tRNA formyltransferase